MPLHGGYSPGAERYGGGVPILRRILESLNRARGTGYNTNRADNSTVWAENMAMARAIMGAWNTNRRLAHQWDPSRLTAFLSRWEKFLGLVVLPTDADPTRRARVAAQLSKWGNIPNRQYLIDALTKAMGPVMVTLSEISLADANAYWPGGATLTGYPWTSTVAHVLIKTTKPVGYTETDFNAAIAMIQPIMDAMAPAWLTWDWYRNGANHIGTGPWAADRDAGFYLDEKNLNYEVFAV